MREAREEAFRELLAEVRRRLDAVRESSSYPAVLRALLRESLAALPAATVLRVDPRDERLAADLLAELGVELEIVGDAGDGRRGGADTRRRIARCATRSRNDSRMPSPR